ncbi:hypothetical protein FRB90_002708 [Tulasnella sp. 427]|nr:hypothetical protein FRB90_002708 [Tulasnella sp. 427]
MSTTHKDQNTAENSVVESKVAASVTQEVAPTNKPAEADGAAPEGGVVEKKAKAVVVRKEIIELEDSDNEEGGETGMADGEAEGFLDAFPNDTEAYALVNLEELWLGKNKIIKLENLAHLCKLRILSIQSNRIVKLEGLEGLVDLEELYISHNGLERLEGLDKNMKLTTVDIGSNRIPKIENISHLQSLEEFWANDNKIPSLHDLEAQLGKTSTLKTIYLEGNPCQKEDMANYRRKVKLALPQLVQIDAT